MLSDSFRRKEVIGKMQKKSLSCRTLFLTLVAAAVIQLVSMTDEVIKAERPIGNFQQIHLMDAVNVNAGIKMCQMAR